MSDPIRKAEKAALKAELAAAALDDELNPNAENIG